MLKGIDINETIEIIPEAEKASSNPTIFVVGNMGQRFNIKFMASCIDESGKPDLRKALENYEGILSSGIRAIKNFDGMDLIEGVQVAVAIPKIDPGTALEIALKIVNMNFPSGQEAKN